MRTHLILDYLFEKSQGRCYICGLPVLRSKPGWATESQWERIMPSKDHVVPKSAGGGIGRMGMHNVRLAHAECNNVKGSEPIHFFKMKQLLLRKFSMLEGKRLRFHYREDGQVKSITQIDNERRT